MSTEKKLDNLVINKVENKEVYKYMQEHSLINTDELYVIPGIGDVGVYVSQTEPTEAADGDLWFDLSSEPVINGDGVSY